MGHCVMHKTYSATWTLNQVAANVIDCVRHSGDRYGTDIVRMPTDKVFDTYDDAIAYIEEVDKHFYDGIAVKYYDYFYVDDNAKIKELRAKIADTVQREKDYIAKHSVKNKKAESIGCRKCGSRLNKELLRSERCPLCNADLRSDTTLERIASFHTKVEEYDKKIKLEQVKRKNKARILWLVKYEYHC